MNLKLVIITILIMSVLCGTASAWLSGFDNRTDIQINNTGNNRTGYQYTFTVDSAVLVAAGKMQADGSDCWITDENDNLLSAWNETSFNLSNTLINVNATSLGNVSNTTHYMYYGNAVASSVMDIGQMAYKLGDDFNVDLGSKFNNAGSALTTPTYDGSGQGIHPSIVYFSSGWNGYKYWMAMTPYPNGDASKENPSILVSNNGSIWVVPSGLANPIEPAPGTGHYSDAELIYNEDTDELWCYYRWCLNTDAKIYLQKSPNGSSWGIKEMVLENTTTHGLVSPAVVKRGNNWQMWYVVPMAGHYEVNYYNSSNGTTWTYNSTIDMDVDVGGNQEPWHLEVRYISEKSEYWMFYNKHDGGYDLLFTRSPNGTVWTKYNKYILSPASSGWDDTFIYRTAFLYNTSNDKIELWYTGKNSAGVWHIGYTDKDYNDFQTFLTSSNVPNTSLWTVEKKGSTSATVALDGQGNVELAGQPSVISSGNLKSIPTFTNGIKISYRRFADAANYRHISLGYGTIVSTSGTTDWWHTTFYDSYIFFIQDDNPGSGHIQIMDSGSLSSLKALDPPNHGAWHTYQHIYRTDGYLEYIADDVSLGNATNTTHLNNAKNILFSQGEHSGGLGGLSDIDYIFVSKYELPEPTASLGAEESAPPSTPIITLLSQTPSIIYKNSTGYLNISYGISHNSSGLNNTSVSFIYRNYDYDLSDSNHSIRPPANDLASVWNFNGRILRAANRNETPGLNFENNATITGGDIYTWSGLDENSTKLTIVPVNSTYTKICINATVHCIMPQMWYLDRTDQQESTKTQLPIHKTQNVLIKFWNFEIFKGNYDFLGVGYTDTSLSSNPALWPSDANPVNFYYVNSSYDPATGGDPITSGYAVYMGSLNASGWVDHVYSRSNSNYVRGFIDNNYLHTVINTTNISYLYFTSNTDVAKPYYINMTNVATSTNRTFANTNTLWAGGSYPLSAQAYTPNVWFAFMKLNMSLDHKLYAADNNDLWGSSSMNRTNITQALFPPTTPVIDHFHFLGETDYDMDDVYYGNFSIGCGVSSDPDGGDVTHNLTLHYANNLTFVAIINNTFTDKDITHNGVYFDANFSSIPYYSQTDNYTLRLIATDDESETVTVWLNKNFSLDGSPRIISYSPETPVSSAEGKNQTFLITTNLPGNVTWYLDSVEVFNEIGVNSSSYSNDNASLGLHNVTVITTNTNGSNSKKWDWTVRTELWAFVEDSITWAISTAQYLVSSIGIVIVTAFSIVCILILMMLIGAALSVTRIIYR